MRIHVLKTTDASPDGRKTVRYESGETYEMPPSLGATFVEQFWGHPEGEPFSAEQIEAADKGAVMSEWRECERLRVEISALRAEIARLTAAKGEAAKSETATDAGATPAAKGRRR